MNREQWLTAMIEQIRPMLGVAHGSLAEKVRVSVGFPSRRGLAAKNRVIGQCWGPQSSEDGVPTILISPTIETGLRAAGVLLHELVHATVGTKEGHKGEFVALGREVGLVKPWTSAMPNEETNAILTGMISTVGDYPHVPLVPKGDGTDGPKKQGTRLVKVICPDCGCPIRMTRRWIDAGAMPTCGCGGKMAEDDAA